MYQYQTSLNSQKLSISKFYFQPGFLILPKNHGFKNRTEHQTVFFLSQFHLSVGSQNFSKNNVFTHRL